MGHRFQNMKDRLATTASKQLEEWESESPRFKSHPMLTFQWRSSYQLNQLRVMLNQIRHWNSWLLAGYRIQWNLVCTYYKHLFIGNRDMRSPESDLVILPQLNIAFRCRPNNSTLWVHFLGCGVLAYKGCGTCMDLLNSTTKAVCLSLDQCSNGESEMICYYYYY